MSGSLLRVALLALLALGVSPMACLAAAPVMPSGGRPAVGGMSPDSLGNARDGTPIRLQQFHGKVVVVTFWATWCGYCMKELPVLANVQRLAGNANLQVVAISHDEKRETFIEVVRRLKDLGLVFAWDGSDAAANAYGVNGIPHMVLIGRDGRIAHVHVGYGEDMLPAIADELNALLAAPATATASP